MESDHNKNVNFCYIFMLAEKYLPCQFLSQLLSTGSDSFMWKLDSKRVLLRYSLYLVQQYEIIKRQLVGIWCLLRKKWTLKVYKVG